MIDFVYYPFLSTFVTKLGGYDFHKFDIFQDKFISYGCCRFYFIPVVNSGSH